MNALPRTMMLETTDWSGFTLGDLREVVFDLIRSDLPGQQAAATVHAVAADLDVLLYLMGPSLGATVTPGQSMQQLAQGWSSTPLSSSSRDELLGQFTSMFYPMVFALKELPQLHAAVTAPGADPHAAVEDHVLRIIAARDVGGVSGPVALDDLPGLSSHDRLRATNAVDDILTWLQAIGVDRLPEVLRRLNPPHGSVDASKAVHVEKIMRRLHQLYTEWDGGHMIHLDQAVRRLVGVSAREALVQTLYAELPRIIRSPEGDPHPRHGVIPMGMLIADSWEGYILDDLRLVLDELVRLGYDWAGDAASPRVRESGWTDDQWADICAPYVDTLALALGMDCGLAFDTDKTQAENLRGWLTFPLPADGRLRLYRAYTHEWVRIMMRGGPLAELHRSLTTPGLSRGDALDLTFTRILHPQQFSENPDLRATYRELDRWDTPGIEAMTTIRDVILTDTAEMSDERFNDLVRQVSGLDAQLDRADSDLMTRIMAAIASMNFRIQGSADARIHHAVGMLLGWDEREAEEVIRAVALRDQTGTRWEEELEAEQAAKRADER